MKTAGTLLIAASIYAGVAAQAGKTTWDGVYTEAQAKRGEAEYSKSCTGCHGPELAGADAAPSLTGAEFNAGWNDLTADDLSERIRTTMPADAAGTLSRQQVADILAFLFAKDGFPPGQSELPQAAEQLKQIKIVATKK